MAAQYIRLYTLKEFSEDLTDLLVMIKRGLDDPKYYAGKLRDIANALMVGQEEGTMTDWQKVSAHTLAGYVEGILDSVETQTKAVPERVEVTDDGDVFVYYDREPCGDGDLELMDKADMLISHHVAEFNKKQAFNKIIGLYLRPAPEGDVVNHIVVPIIQTRFEMINGLTGESLE